jgi:hypothetical protein
MIMCAVRERDYRRQWGIFKAGETADRQVEEKRLCAQGKRNVGMWIEGETGARRRSVVMQFNAERQHWLRVRRQEKSTKIQENERLGPGSSETAFSLPGAR